MHFVVITLFINGEPAETTAKKIFKLDGTMYNKEWYQMNSPIYGEANFVSIED